MTEPANSNAPKIRFKSHSETWKTEAVSTLLKERNVQAPKSAEYPLMAFIAEQGVAPKGKRYNREFLVSDELNKKYKQTELGDFIYSSNNLETGSIGTNRYGKASISPVYSIFAPTPEGDSSFIGQLLCKKTFINKMVKWRQGVVYGQWRIHESDFLRIESNFPTVDEQAQVGSYFRELDHLIGLHQQKHDKLVQLKKAMLQKMFPQPGSSIPEIRFKGFSGEWVEKKLHSLADRYDNLRIPVSASNRIPGNTPYYGANGIQDYVHGYTHQGEFILVAEDGANDLKNYPVQYVSGKVWVNNHAHVLQGKFGLAETRFLKYAFAQINVETFLVGGGRSKLNAETMMQLEIRAPADIEEQQKIGSYFRSLEDLISKHAIHLQKLKQIKAACLEKMFV